MNKFTLDKAGNYGEVRTVNGIKPDENGNVNAGEKVDLILDISARDDSTIQADDIVIAEGSLENVMSVIRDHKTPVVKLRFYYEEGNDYMMYGHECNASVYRYGGSVYFGYIYSSFSGPEMRCGSLRFDTDGMFEQHKSYKCTLTSI